MLHTIRTKLHEATSLAKKKIKILCIGNSHTAGFPLFDPMFGGDIQSSYEYWFNLLLSSHFSGIPFKIDNKGICGQVSGEVYQRLKAILTNKNYDLVIFWSGANDLAIGYSVDTIWKNLWRAYELAKQKSTPFLLVTIPPMNWPGIDSKITKLNEKIKSNSGSTSYLIADTYQVLAKQRALNPLYDAGDGVHLSITGYEEVGQEIFNQVSPFLEKLLKYR